MYNTILVPINLSHKRSGVKATKIAKKLINDGGEIILINVLEDVPSYIEAELPKDLRENTKKEVLLQITKISKENSISSNVQIRSGHAASSILEAAESYNADLIIIASHRPGLSDYFLGSTAARVVRHAQCPVLVDR